MCLRKIVPKRQEASVPRGKKKKGEVPRRKMQAAKLQDLIMQLSKRLIMRTKMKLSKAEKIKRRVERQAKKVVEQNNDCLLYTSPSPRDS